MLAGVGRGGKGSVIGCVVAGRGGAGRTTGSACGGVATADGEAVGCGRAGAGDETGGCDTTGVGASDSTRGRSGGAALGERSGARGMRNSSSIDVLGAIVSTPPHTEHRARTACDGIFAGSTRNTDRHSGHVTFTSPPLPPSGRRAPGALAPPWAKCPVDDRSRTPIPAASSRSFSSPSPARSPAQRA